MPRIVDVTVLAQELVARLNVTKTDMTPRDLDFARRDLQKWADGVSGEPKKRLERAVKALTTACNQLNGAMNAGDRARELLPECIVAASEEVDDVPEAPRIYIKKPSATVDEDGGKLSAKFTDIANAKAMIDLIGSGNYVVTTDYQQIVIKENPNQMDIEDAA